MRNGIIHAASKLLSSAGGESNTVLVDVSQTRTIFWPLVRSLGERVTWDSSHRTRGRSGPFSISIIISELVRALLIRPVNRIYKALAEGVKKNKKDADDVNLERGQPAPEMPRTTFIVHGVRDTEQANELWTLVDQFKDKLKTRFKSSGSDVRPLFGSQPNSAGALRDGVHRIGGSKAERYVPFPASDFRLNPGILPPYPAKTVFGTLSGIIRLSTKYQVELLRRRRRAVVYLSIFGLGKLQHVVEHGRMGREQSAVDAERARGHPALSIRVPSLNQRPDSAAG
ncbi:hypothetical protein B0H14DRAFT_3567337 [Mycena olivaceomarginata]|nr:hypothetical protein B0H14DRAFT_3567337 [Mycena olivaceomarginata]